MFSTLLKPDSSYRSDYDLATLSLTKSLPAMDFDALDAMAQDAMDEDAMDEDAGQQD
jgi:hypothetical protein